MNGFGEVRNRNLMVFWLCMISVSNAPGSGSWISLSFLDLFREN